ncbi:MAG: hypothetical protein OER88_10685 [Planctomycetota bacterium]|nr:hypothetical protein [Planctomycetota bacterium]
MVDRARGRRLERAQQLAAALTGALGVALIVGVVGPKPSVLWIVLFGAGGLAGIRINASIPRALAPRVRRVLRTVGWTVIGVAAFPLGLALQEALTPPNPQALFDLGFLAVFFYGAAAVWLCAAGAWLLLTSRAPDPEPFADAF